MALQYEYNPLGKVSLRVSLGKAFYLVASKKGKNVNYALKASQLVTHPLYLLN